MEIGRNRLEINGDAVAKVPTPVTSIPDNRDNAAPDEAMLEQLGQHPALAVLGIAVTQIVRLVDRRYRYEGYERTRALSIDERISDNQAAVRLLGISYDRLGLELLTRWGFPQRLLHALSPCPEPIRFNTNTEARLQPLAAFCIEVALLLRLPTLTARRQAIETQLQRFGAALRLERHHLKAHLLLADAQALEMSQ